MAIIPPNSGFVRGVSHWYFCVVIAMAAQMLLLLLWSFLGPSNGLNRIMEPVYVSAAYCIGATTSLYPDRSSWGPMTSQFIPRFQKIS